MVPGNFSLDAIDCARNCGKEENRNSYHGKPLSAPDCDPQNSQPQISIAPKSGVDIFISKIYFSARRRLKGLAQIKP